MPTLTSHDLPLRNELAWLIHQARAPRVRTMRRFAEEEIIIPNGPYAGRKFNCRRQPYTALFFDAVDSHLWDRICATGPTQSGKTLACFVTPTCYHLFEMMENVVCGVPHMDMAGDKWREDILPVIERTRYRNLLPAQGAGSRGGNVRKVEFRNGATLKFMSGGGGDKSRAGFTSRVLVVTETDGMDTSGGTSREADKITQLEGRTRAYRAGFRRLTYMECTVSIAEGRTWREYLGGTASRIFLLCPHCGRYVFPEREHLVGWREASNEVEASRLSNWHCPSCGEAWTEADRHQANLDARLMHRGQEMAPDGAIHGQPAETQTFGFRWDSYNSFFANAGDIGSDEWLAAASPDEDNAEKEMRQFVWALPYEPPAWDETPLDYRQVRRRFGDWPKGEIPADAEWVTLGVDLGKRVGYFLGVAWRAGAAGHVFDYGTFEVPSDDLGVERALWGALREFRERCEIGWLDSTGARRRPDQVWVDNQYETPIVQQWIREGTRRYLPVMGQGTSKYGAGIYSRPAGKNKVIVFVGEDYHVERLAKERVYRVTANADHWKGWIQHRLSIHLGRTPEETPPGAMTVFRGTSDEHTTLAKHLTAEKPITEFIEGKGFQTRWKRVNRANHYLDAAYLAAAAGHFCGVRLVPEPPTTRPARPRRSPLTLPDGRPFLITER